MMLAVWGGWCRGCLGFLGWCLVVRLGLWRVCSGFLGFRRPVGWVQAVLPRGSCLLGRGSWVISSGFAEGLWVLVWPLMFWLCYWSDYRGAGVVFVLLVSAVVAVSGFSAWGLWKDANDSNHPICYLPTKVGDSDAKCHEIEFSNKCCC